jgi:protein subunit release factor B
MDKFEAAFPSEVALPENDADLLAECEVDTFRAGGPGGQHQNKTESAVRLRHRPTGLVVTCRQNRSQYQNKNICLKRLRAKVARLNETPAERRPTRPSAAARERRLEDKARQAGKKRERRPPQSRDEE